MFEEEYAKNQIICWTTCFTVALQKYQVKVSHAKISRIFSPNKNASTEPHNYPLNLFFSLNKDLVCFWHVFFFLNVSHNISQNMTFWKDDSKNCRNVIPFWTANPCLVQVYPVVICIMKSTAFSNARHIKWKTLIFLQPTQLESGQLVTNAPCNGISSSCYIFPVVFSYQPQLLSIVNTPFWKQ